MRWLKHVLYKSQNTLYKHVWSFACCPDIAPSPYPLCTGRDVPLETSTSRFTTVILPVFSEKARRILLSCTCVPLTWPLQTTSAPLLKNTSWKLLITPFHMTETRFINKWEFIATFSVNTSKYTELQRLSTGKHVFQKGKQLRTTYKSILQLLWRHIKAIPHWKPTD